MLLLRLSGRKTCERVKEKGCLWRGKHFVVRYLPGAPRNLSAPPSASAIYVGTLTSAKLHKSAVKRNRMRRRCKEALRIASKSAADRLPLTADRSFQLLILPKSSSLSAAFGELLSDADRLLSSLFSACQTQPRRRNPPSSFSSRLRSSS